MVKQQTDERTGLRVLRHIGSRIAQSRRLHDGARHLQVAHARLTSHATCNIDLVVHWNHEFRSKKIGADALADSDSEGTFYLGVNLPPAWSFKAQLDYLTEDNSTHETFPGAFVQLKPDAASLVRLFVGRSKGGLKCSGGVCRIFPDFEGVKLETTLRFRAAFGCAGSS